MKIILSAFGSVAVQVSGDDVAPERGLLQRDLVQFVGNLYDFAVRPVIPPNVSPQMFPVLTFQQGRFVNEGGTFAIQALVILQNGDIVSAANTDIAEMIMDDYITKLETNLDYRYHGKPQNRYYSSAIVVEFEQSIGERIAGLQEISRILTREMPQPSGHLALRALDFGQADPVTNITSPQDVGRIGFRIERRLGEPFERHRFFCNAATKTSDHIRILEMVEATLGNQSRLSK